MDPEPLAIRDARAQDLDALASVRYAETPAVHRDRILAATSGDLRYRVAERDGAIVGFGMLVLRWPSAWPRSETPELLPRIIDLFVAESERGQGIGAAMVADMERLARETGNGTLYVRVDPVENPRARALYERIGYRATSSEPFRDAWRFTDSAGTVHQGQNWAIDLAKKLG
jgi:GNAT superfamily N-acetyltransferase